MNCQHQNTPPYLCPTTPLPRNPPPGQEDIYLGLARFLSRLITPGGNLLSLKLPKKIDRFDRPFWHLSHKKNSKLSKNFGSERWGGFLTFLGEWGPGQVRKKEGALGWVGVSHSPPPPDQREGPDRPCGCPGLPKRSNSKIKFFFFPALCFSKSAQNSTFDPAV